MPKLENIHFPVLACSYLTKYDKLWIILFEVHNFITIYTYKMGLTNCQQKWVGEAGEYLFGSATIYGHGMGQGRRWLALSMGRLGLCWHWPDLGITYGKADIW